MTVEIRSLDIFLKVNLDQTVRIHDNDFNCKVLNNTRLSGLHRKGRILKM
jgi:hypothetical protein